MKKLLSLLFSISLISYLILISNLTIIISNADRSSQVSRIELEESPYWLAFNDNNGYIYTTNREDSSIYVIDTLEQRVVETIGLTEAPSYIIFNPSNGKMYVTAESSIFVINSANQVEKQIPIEHPSTMTFNPLQNSTYVTQPPLDRVQIIDSSDNLTDTISINNPYAIDFNPSNNYMYVTELENNFVSVIDTNNQVKDRILVGKGPTSIEFNPINNNMYVSHRSSDTVSIIDSKTNELVTSIIPEPGATGSDIEFNPRDNNMYVSTNTGIYIIDSNSNDVIGKYRDGADALSMAFNPLDGKMYYTQPYQFPPHIGSLSASIHLPTAVCPIEYLQHWEIISFTIKSKEVAQILEIPFNQEKGSTNTLDIIFQRPNDYIPTEFISLEQTVLNHLRNEVKLPSSLQNIIEIVDVEYTTICAEDFYSNNIIENKFDESQNRNNTNVTTIKKLS